MPKRYPKDQRDRAIRMALDRLDEHPSLYAACNPIGPNVGIAGIVAPVDRAGSDRCRNQARTNQRGRILTVNESTKVRAVPDCEWRVAADSAPEFVELVESG